MRALPPFRRVQPSPLLLGGALDSVQPPAPASLAAFDVIVVSSSAGKDSQVTLDVVARAAAAAGVLDRVVVLHCDLGEAEWPGVPELAAAQAAYYGVRFVIRRRARGGLLDLIRARGQWPDYRARFCTAAMKRDVGRRLMTELVRDLNLLRPARILHCLGLRAAESTARARKEPFQFDAAASNKTRRQVWAWLPIHDYSDAEVWARIHATGVPYHPVYDLGVRRLSCTFCPLAGRADLVRACQLRPESAQDYLRLEIELGVPFRPGHPLADIYTDALRTARADDPIVTGQSLLLPPIDAPAVRWTQ